VDDKGDYERNREPVEEFARRARQLLPEITEADLTLAYSGIRAKLTAPGAKGYSDFVIERDANWPNVIHLVGMDSPGLTSALAIARHVAKMLAE
jgi:glycerol-3-phosphate dehydrogenase